MLKKIIKDILKKNKHSFKNRLYKSINLKLINEINKNDLRKKNKKKIDFSIFGKIVFPFFSMGSINSLHLFGLDEIILFCYYFSSRKKYKKVADIGGNIGLHSIIMSRFYDNVDCYEPDINHVKKIKENLKLNKIKNVKIVKKAVTTKNGRIKFVRVLGNTTGSHIFGAKKKPYGKLEKFSVKCVKFSKIVKDYDFIKIDAEGEEAKIIKDTRYNDWDNLDVVLEVGSEKNAKDIFRYLNYLDVKMYSQKKNWKKVEKAKDMPFSYKEGSLFISKRNKFHLEKI